MVTDRVPERPALLVGQLGDQGVSRSNERGPVPWVPSRSHGVHGRWLTRLHALVAR